MVIYKCQCGDEFPILENTEISRDQKRIWKSQHNEYHSDGSLNVGHNWKRIVIRKGNK